MIIRPSYAFVIRKNLLEICAIFRLRATFSPVKPSLYAAPTDRSGCLEPVVTCVSRTGRVVGAVQRAHYKTEPCGSTGDRVAGRPVTEPILQ